MEPDRPSGKPGMVKVSEPRKHIIWHSTEMTTRLRHFDYNALNLSSSENIGLSGNSYIRKNREKYVEMYSIASHN